MATTEFRYDDAPMADDRGVGWAFVRERGAVVAAPDGTFFLTSPEAVAFAHKHPELFASGPAFAALASPVPLVPLATDPPDHVRYRRILDPMLAPRVINQMEPELRRQIGDLVDAIAERGECDVLADIARLYPTQVFMTLFGLPLEDRDTFISWVETLNEGAQTSAGEPSPALVEAAMALFGYMQGFIDTKRENLGDDMLSRGLALTGEDAWTNDEILGLCFLFTLAGLDTVTAEIGFMFLHLAQAAELRRRVVGDPELVGPFIEEVVRIEPPAPLTPRVTTADVEVGGVMIPAGSLCQLALGAVNRDPARGATADTIDLDHGDRGHLGFGGGIHRCLGSHLARRELRLVFEEFHRRIPDYDLAPGSQPRVVWPSGTLHLEALSLVFPKRGVA
jgi:cytochrome P450